jgi:hypothetical protein
MMSGRELHWTGGLHVISGEQVAYLTPQANDFFVPSWTDLPSLAQHSNANSPPMNRFIHS